jgi:hypothetical protein
MTTNNDTYIKTVAAAEQTKTNSIAAARAAFESSITAAKNDIGYREGFPTGYSAFSTSVAQANATLRQAIADAERVKQQTIEVARDLIRGQGEGRSI